MFCWANLQSVKVTTICIVVTLTLAIYFNILPDQLHPPHREQHSPIAAFPSGTTVALQIPLRSLTCSLILQTPVGSKSNPHRPHFSLCHICKPRWGLYGLKNCMLSSSYQTLQDTLRCSLSVTWHFRTIFEARGEPSQYQVGGLNVVNDRCSITLIRF